MSIDRNAYGSTLVEPSPRTIALPSRHTSLRHRTSARDSRRRTAADRVRSARALGEYGGALRGIAVRDRDDGGELPAVVRQPGIVESVTAHAITVRCGEGFADAYVLVADLSADADAAPQEGRDRGRVPTFEHLRPGDEVMVTSWLDPDERAG